MYLAICVQRMDFNPRSYVGATGNCQKWFKSHKPKPELVAQMINAVNQQKQSKQWQEGNGKFIPNPYTWLNGERWLDELPKSESELFAGTELSEEDKKYSNFI